MGAAQPILDTSKLGKRYVPSQPWAVHDLSLHILTGEIFGFIGPNGAGKTTTIKMLMGMVLPTSGGGTIFGLDIVRDTVAIRRRIGFMSGDVNLYQHFTGRDLLALVQRLHGGGSKERFRSLCERFDVPLERKIKTYSSGQKAQVALIAALAHDSDLLILDEPTKGLDPSRKRDFLDLIAERGRAGAAVIISSHVLSEIESICTRVGFIRDGMLLGHEEIAAVQQRLANLIIVTFEEEVEADRLAALSGVNEVTRRGNEFILTVGDDGRTAVKQLADLPISSLRYQHAMLDDLYESLYLNDRTEKAQPREPDDTRDRPSGAMR